MGKKVSQSGAADVEICERVTCSILDSVVGIVNLERRGADQRVAEEVKQRPEAVGLMTHPGVGPVTALAMVLTLGPAERFESAEKVGSYFGLIPP